MAIRRHGKVRQNQEGHLMCFSLSEIGDDGGIRKMTNWTKVLGFSLVSK